MKHYGWMCAIGTHLWSNWTYVSYSEGLVQVRDCSCCGIAQRRWA